MAVGRVAQIALATNVASKPKKPDIISALSIARRSFAKLRGRRGLLA
jgi:hypothetical protein